MNFTHQHRIETYSKNQSTMSDEKNRHKYTRSGWDSTYTTTNKSTTFLQNIREEYGENNTGLLKKYMRINRRLTEAKSKRRFLLQCRTKDTKPNHISNFSKNVKHLQFYSNFVNKKFSKNVEIFKFKLLNLEIEDINIHVKYLQKSLTRISNEIEEQLNNDVFNEFIDTQKEKSTYEYYKLNNKYICKLNRTLRIADRKNRNNGEITNNININNNSTINTEKWFHNLTDINIPKEIVDTVALGPKFNDVFNINKRDTVIQTIKNIENMIDSYNFNDEASNNIRNNVINSINGHISRTKHINYEDRVFAQRLRKIETFSKTNDVFFTMADKGNATVAISNTQYKQKMDNLLLDKRTYTQIKSNPLVKLQKSVQKIMNRWNDNNYFNKKYHKNELTQTNTVLSKIYGLPKIHKKDAPLRPIVSCIGSPTYNLSKTLDKILRSNIPKPKSYIKNSFDLIQKMKDIVIPNEHVIVSLDVTSLFTNVPQELVTKALEKRYEYLRHLNIPLTEIIDTSRFLMNNTVFQFNGKYYRQIFGSPMGSPISPSFADMVMVDLEEICIKKLDFVPLFYYRYVDDIILCLPKSKIKQTLDIFNSYHESLQFTHEIEQDNTISFLELKLIKKNSQIITDWYHKPTFSGRFLNFKSHHPMSQKRAMIYNLVDRAILLADKKFWEKNIRLAKEYLIMNNYPIKFIEFHVKNRLNKIKFSNNKNHNSNLNLKKIIVSLPYIPNSFEEVSKNLSKIGIKSVPLINNNLSKIIKRGKDLQEKGEKTNTVYKIDCKDCNASYVGESKRMLNTRIKEHISNTQKADKKFVINNHMTQHKHEFDFDNVKILDSESCWKKRLISEMVNIKLQDNPINIKEDTQNLSNHYTKILDKLKKVR